MLAATGADDLGGNRFVDVLLFESQQRLNAACHVGVFAEARLLQFHALDVGVQLPILATDAPQVEVAIPPVARPLLGVNDRFFERCEGTNGPDADETNFAVLGRTPHLDSKRNDLGEQNGRQYDQVSVATENRVHGKAGTTGRCTDHFRR